MFCQATKMWDKILAEAQMLLDNDKSVLVASYTQSLMELLAWVRVPCEPVVPFQVVRMQIRGGVPLRIGFQVENAPEATVDELKKAAAKDEDLSIAMSLARAMGETELVKEDLGGVQPMEEMDDELRLALQMSVANPDESAAPAAVATVRSPLRVACFVFYECLGRSCERGGRICEGATYSTSSAPGCRASFEAHGFR